MNIKTNINVYFVCVRLLCRVPIVSVRTVHREGVHVQVCNCNQCNCNAGSAYRTACDWRDVYAAFTCIVQLHSQPRSTFQQKNDDFHIHRVSYANKLYSLQKCFRFLVKKNNQLLHVYFVSERDLKKKYGIESNYELYTKVQKKMVYYW